MNLLIAVVTILTSLTNGVLVICYVPHDGHLDMQSAPYLMQDTPELSEKSLYNSGVGKNLFRLFCSFITKKLDISLQQKKIPQMPRNYAHHSYLDRNLLK